MRDTWQKLLEPQTVRNEKLAAALRSKNEGRATGNATATTLATGQGWRVVDIVCTSGPQDRPFEERHDGGSISLVLAGTFVYRCSNGSSLMAAGSLLLGGPGRNYECSHHHGGGDHCLSFQFAPELFDRLAGDAGVDRRGPRVNRLPPLPALSAVSARAVLARNRDDCWEELAFDLSATALECAGETRKSRLPSSAEWARVSRVIATMETSIEAPHPLIDLAAAARMSTYHFLRTFKAMTGITPHQWLLRARLRNAAHRLVATTSPVTSIALDVGFEDLSNFIRSFRAEFGVSPSRCRASA